MIIFFALLYFFASVLLFVILLVSHRENKDTFPIAIIGALATIFLLVGIKILVGIGNQPISVMDVYQGKTILKYEVVDDIKVDSTVVWKEHYND